MTSTQTQAAPLIAGTPERAVCEWDSLPNELFNFWTIGNVSEVIPGVLRPLSASLYRTMDYLGTTKLVRDLDSLDLLPSQPPPIGNFISNFGGRAVLNLAWANAIIGVWQTGEGSDLMGQFITSTDGQDIASGRAADSERAARTFARIRRIWGQLPHIVEMDRVREQRQRRQERGRDLGRLSDRRLWRHVQSLVRDVRCYTHHLFVSGAAGEYAQWLGKLLDKELPGHDPALIVGLTSALREVESARPSKGAWDVAQAVRRRKALLAEVEVLPPHAIAAKLAARRGADWKAFAERFGAFIAEFGFRGQREADPSAADWEEEPAFAISAVKAFLHAGTDHDPYRLEEAAARRREAVEAEVRRQLPRGVLAEFNRLLAGSQRFARLREASKANWVRSLRPVRAPLLELARRFVARGLIADLDDFWYLLADEVERGVQGELAAGEAHAAVQRRRAVRDRLELYSLPEVFSTPVELLPLQPAQAPAAGALSGMPVSAGRATGKARVVLSAEAAEEVELEPGEVLVAPFTDAPWTPLFVPAAAVVVETGGLLSHAATVARE
ncbi:MAG TPA: PEP-utilizing enzyme, partial [Dehalococcoidia bacterium]|nr:PEP-utilizing enzyme [Dehalococcoidia bacterium]